MQEAEQRRDAYREVGGRQRREQVVEQLPRGWNLTNGWNSTPHRSCASCARGISTSMYVIPTSALAPASLYRLHPWSRSPCQGEGATGYCFRNKSGKLILRQVLVTTNNRQITNHQSLITE